MISTLAPLLLASAGADAAPECPAFEIITSEQEPGLLEFFVLQQPDDVTYNWTVSAGTIESGQGTFDIFVRAELGDIVTATVEIGELDSACPSTFSASEESMLPPEDEPDE